MGKAVLKYQGPVTIPRGELAAFEPCGTGLLKKIHLEVEERNIPMIKPVHSLKFYKICSVAVLIVVTGVSCLPAADAPAPTPVLQIVEVTREVTQVVTQAVTQEVTQEVTRIVEVPVPVTVTPTLTPEISLTPSLTSTITRTPTITPTPEAPRVTVLVHAACYYGPGDVYLYKYGLLATSWMEVIGRNPDGTYLWVQGGDHKNPCWMRADQAQFIKGGDVNNYNIPVAYSFLPYSNLYKPPTAVKAIRSGNKVTIYWNAVWMTEDDYEGYLIEAYLCHDGQLVFTPMKHKPPLSGNTGLLGIIVTDEPGCLVPSSARIYTAEKHGYTGYKMIPWPPYDLSPTPTP
jgi:hypothetical protein